jgi:MurNAc alpha-1-phosphate uridylyltransferase
MTGELKAMILAAGRGERLRPLTDTTPKPLIEVAGKPLIRYHIDRLRDAGMTDIVINTAWLADSIHDMLGDGSRFGVSISYSDEGTALETAGGIIRALPKLGEEPFLVINGDIWCDYDFTSLPVMAADKLAHLVLVDNPQHNPAGDFAIENGLIRNHAAGMLTFSGIGIYRKALFEGQAPGPLPLAPILREMADQGLVSGEHYAGRWTDVGTIERLEQLDHTLRHGST